MAVDVTETRPPEAPGARGAGTLRVVALELTEPTPDVPLDGHGGARVIALHRGVPVGEVDIPAPPGTGVLGADLVADTVLEHLWWPAWRAVLAERVRDRLGALDPADHPRRSVTVVVCTRDHHEHLERCLGALGRLDPAPDDVVVVDNASAEPCDDLVRAAGFRYVFEPIAGLDNARNRGLSEVRTEVMAMTDDDCLPVPGWLATLPRNLSSRAVAAVTGIGCPYRLDSPAQVAFEAAAGFSLGYVRRSFDSASLRPTDGGVVGAGANMAVRAETLRALGGFPPELDVGTPTRSGGDTYMLFRLLAAGWRVVYDPAQMVWHNHKATEDAVQRALRGYGTGLAAMSTRALVVDHFPGAITTATWPARNLARTAARAGRMRASIADVVGAWDLAAGTVRGPGAWRAARRLPGRVPGAAPAGAAVLSEPAPPLPPETGGIELTVVIPTIARRREALRRCVAALHDQTLARERYEIIAVPNGPGSDSAPHVPGVDRMLPQPAPSKGGARNAGAMAARGAVVVFIDDDVIADRGCLAAHLEAVQGRGVVSLGPYYPAPGDAGDPLGQMVMRWWYDTFARMRRPDHRFTFVDLITGNLGMGRELFASTGGFAPEFPDREDWELGWRLLERGARFAATPAASALHEHAVTPLKSLADSRGRGYGDVMFVARHPAALSSLPLARMAPLVGTRRWGMALRLGALAEGPAGRRLVELPLAGLRAGGAWRRWLRLFARLQAASYCLGVQRALDDGHVLQAGVRHTTVLDLDGDEPVVPSVALGEVEVRLRGRRLGAVTVDGAQWDADGIAEAVAEGVGAVALAVEGRSGGIWAAAGPTREVAP